MKQTPIEAVFRSASGRFIAGVTVRRVATASAEGVPSKEKQPCLDDRSYRAIKRPWHNWIARRPPEPKVAGSNPAGRTGFLSTQGFDGTEWARNS